MMNDLTDEKNRVLIENVRKRFASEVESHPELYHEMDVERVRSEEWQIERFLLDSGDEDEAFKGLTKALQWKKSFGIHDRTDGYFPRELYQIFGHEKYSTDRLGRLAIWVAHKNYRKMGDYSLLFQQFVGHQIEKLDRRAGNRGWLTVNDCANAGLANVDMALAKFRVELLSYYPKGMKIGLNVDMPWILGPVFKIVKTFMSRHIKELIVLIRREELSDYFDLESVPMSFGGKREESVADVVKELSPLHELKHLQLNDKQINEFYNVYKIER